MRYYTANFGQPTRASTSPRHQHVGDSCTTIRDLCVMFVCVPTCLSMCESTYMCSWRPRLGRERLGSWWCANLIDGLSHRCTDSWQGFWEDEPGWRNRLKVTFGRFVLSSDSSLVLSLSMVSTMNRNQSFLFPSCLSGVSCHNEKTFIDTECE